ncbi:hypothetical protein LCGC14_2843220, partial [marine sediment metagenome]
GMSMPDDLMKIIAHNPLPEYGNSERKKVGEIAGIEVWSDPNLPDDELRVVQGNKIVQRIKLAQ